MNKLSTLEQILKNENISALRASMLSHYDDLDSFFLKVDALKLPESEKKLLHDFLKCEIHGFGILDFIDDLEWESITFDGPDSTSLFGYEDGQEYRAHYKIGLGTPQNALNIIERICVEVGVRFDERECVLHRQWRDVVTYGIAPSVLGRTFLRLIKKSSFADFVTPALPL